MWKRQQKPLEWTEQFTLVVRAAAHDDALDLVAATERLQHADGAMLLRFDHFARRVWEHSAMNPQDRTRAVLKQALGKADLAEYLLFHEACNGSGYVREHALRALRGHQSRLACAATLVRADDWVPQVATLAENMLADLTITDRARYLFDFLDLILALRRRSRFERVWPAVERALLAPQWRAQRLTAAGAASGIVRRFALELILKADVDSTATMLVAAAKDPSPQVSIWAMATANRILHPDELLAVLREGLTNPLSFVRSDAMRRYLRSGFGEAHELLRQFALDPSHGVRATAAHYLKEDFGESVLPLWRSTFDARRMIDAMTLSLAESGEDADQERLRRQLGAPRSRTRAAALRGLWRLGASDIGELLKQGMHDPASLVISATARIISRSGETLDRSTLESALSQAIRPGLKASLLGASRLLRKWDRLAFLMSRCVVAPEDAIAVEHEIDLWLRTANRSFAPPMNEQKTEIHDLLTRLRRERPSRQLDLVEFHC